MSTTMLFYIFFYPSTVACVIWVTALELLQWLLNDDGFSSTDESPSILCSLIIILAEVRTTLNNIMRRMLPCEVVLHCSRYNSWVYKATDRTCTTFYLYV
jgi:hypothetical protein